MRLFTSLPRVNSLLRSSPKSLMAMLAFVPDSMASMRCEMGWPISTSAPLSVDSFCRTSATNSSRLRSDSSNGASSSEVLTPRACSSSSARPVLRATVFISGIVMSRRSARLPMESDSASEMPGTLLTLMVNDPSLNDGRKLLPKKNVVPTATQNSTMVPAMMGRLCRNARSSRMLYLDFSHTATAESLTALPCLLPPSR